jgi:hypothetical protein
MNYYIHFILIAPKVLVPLATKVEQYWNQKDKEEAVFTSAEIYIGEIF